MVHGTEEGPCGQAIVMCIGKLNPESNIGYSKELFDKIAEIGIPSNRLYILFNEVQSYQVGISGTTAKELGL
jgi:hypothetical protein